ncbi:DUF2955 domain-containing protein [Photobacterium sp. SDRW27]|uniref:DUF2955 domain-containing protein n=1 Tax=Photobacterium obscurum TaxID=2829490 RepID=UPI002243D632|nr:DUF2955 domain-containing protein [Photobacterium obscurum]MCW8328699.1 DUF2955 domain-containing protein [Photobacterium obscurum]
MKTFRIWFGCVLGLTISMVFGWSNGMFATLLPMFVLSRMEHWHLGILLQVFLSIVWCSLQVTAIIGFLQPYPMLMTVAVGIMLLFKCFAMGHKSTYLFGYVGLLIGSILLNYGSYNSFDLEDFIIGLWIAAITAIPIAAMAFYLFPEPQTDQVKPPVITVNNQRRDPLGMIRQAALGWIVAMSAFILFQVADLQDSSGAQASIIIVLAPMTLVGALGAAKIRIIGTFIGCFAAMLIQLGLYTLSNNGLLFILAYAIAAGIFCRWLTTGTIKASIGFSAISALTIPLTTAFVPEQQDAFFSILYRFNSIFIVVIVASLMIWIVHHFLIRTIHLKNREI